MNVLLRPVPAADHRIPYGSEALQFGDLWIPDAPAHSLLPLVVFFHGGWWRSEFNLGYAGHLCAALKKDGIACWSVEYRRVGNVGGGWPGTFQDAAAGFDFARILATRYPLDLSRVIAMGHSAGGHLAFWLAGRHHIESQSPVFEPRPQVPLLGVIGLAGVVDLRLTIDLSSSLTYAHDKLEIYALVGGKPQDLPDRYRACNPGDLLPFNVPQLLIQGTEDGQIPSELPSRWAEISQRAGDRTSVSMIQSADHFDVVDPDSHAWRTVRDAVRKMAFP